MAIRAEVSKMREFSGNQCEYNCHGATSSLEPKWLRMIMLVMMMMIIMMMIMIIIMMMMMIVDD